MRILIGAQLYTLRHELKSAKDVRSAFEFIRSAGCEVVELAGLPKIKPQELAKISADTGVAICSTHSPYSRIEGDLDRLADEHSVYGCNIIGIGSMPSEHYNRKSQDDIKRFADFLNGASERLSDRKMKIMYHNHKFEFKRLGGKRIMDTLLDLTAPEVAYSLDIYWAHAGGANVEDYIDIMGDRLAVMHLKDFKPTFLGLGNSMATPGDGILDIKSYLRSAEANGTPYAVIEVDKTSSPRDAITRGIKFINEIY